MAASKKVPTAIIKRQVSLETGGKITLPPDFAERVGGGRSLALTRHPDGLIELRPQQPHNNEKASSQISLDEAGAITFPEVLLIGLDEGSLFSVSQRVDGAIELRLQESSDPSQWWYWTDRWQQMEREAAEDYAAGRYKQFDNVEDFLADLDAHHET